MADLYTGGDRRVYLLRRGLLFEVGGFQRQKSGMSGYMQCNFTDDLYR